MEKRGWRDIPIGGMIVEAGSAEEYETGDWRTYRPVVDQDACIDCLQCWIHCPDASIQVEEEKMTGFDYKHCKGCGICAQICPADAIQMEKE